MIPHTLAAYDLMHQGAIALAEMECNGFAVDMDYVNKVMARTTEKVQHMNAKLESSEVVKVWRKKYGTNTNLQSGEQLGEVLFGAMGFPDPGRTDGGGYKTDEEALETVDHPFVRDYLDIKKRIKGKQVLEGIAREVVDGLVHCFFNLHVARSYRSSCNDPNLQNVPIRDPYIKKLVRQAFIARRGRQLVEIDFKGAEVCVGACYHKDPIMISYILDKSKDMHRDMAMECFKLTQTDVSKLIRGAAKGSFVFAEFYGDWYPHCASNLWKAVIDPAVKTESGVILLDHMHAKGFTELGDCSGSRNGPVKGTFEHHIKQVEDRFWGQRFKVYAEWKKQWYEQYQRQTWFETLSGFICQGYMEKNQCTNYPIQGSSFHCLLWALTRIVREELRKYKMKSMAVCQIHDSLLGDVVPEELDDYLSICNTVITRKLRKYYPWLVVPIEVEYEVSPVGGSWADKKGYHL